MALAQQHCSHATGDVLRIAADACSDMVISSLLH
jgi:hypothetical protein